MDDHFVKRYRVEFVLKSIRAVNLDARSAEEARDEAWRAYNDAIGDYMVERERWARIMPELACGDTVGSEVLDHVVVGVLDARGCSTDEVVYDRDTLFIER